MSRSVRSALAGKTVLVTRARAQSEELVRLLSEHDAKPLVFPVIEIHPPSDPKPLRAAVASLAHAPSHAQHFDWVVFTSANGVRATFDEIDRQKIENAFRDVKIAVVGPATSRELEARGVHVDLVAKEFVGDSLATDLISALQKKSRIVLFRAKVARELLPGGLRAAGHTVDVVAAYETHPASPVDTSKIADALDRGEIDFVTFTSSSTATQLCALLGSRAQALLGKTRIVSIGPVTTAAAEKAGLVVRATASPHTIAALVETMAALF